MIVLSRLDHPTWASQRKGALYIEGEHTRISAKRPPVKEIGVEPNRPVRNLKKRNPVHDGARAVPSTNSM